MNWNAIQPTVERARSAFSPVDDNKEKPLTVRERGRRTILVGWLVTMIGIVGYIVTMSRAGEGAEMLDALASQGLLGWGSLSVLLTGVIVWVIGSVAMLHDVTKD
jgi:hypothetical protein